VVKNPKSVPAVGDTLRLTYIVCLAFLLILPFTNLVDLVKADSGDLEENQPASEKLTNLLSNNVYLPVLFSPQLPVKSDGPKVNVPEFEDSIIFEETAIFWFGQVALADNYADVRIGYNSNELYVKLAVFDRRTWYDTSPSTSDLTAWDAASLYISTDSSGSKATDTNAYRFIGQLNLLKDDPHAEYQAAYQGNGTGWSLSSIPFTTRMGYRSVNGPNNDEDDRGWAITYHVPFTSLGLTGPPAQGNVWRLAVILHDRDDAGGMPIQDKYWPEGALDLKPSTWGQIEFGLPGAYLPPPSNSSDSVTIRQGVNGASVVDGHVGGHSICGSDFAPNYFDGWGDANYAGYTQINIQNQADISDWPCFSKYYIKFPLDQVPTGNVIVSAKLTLYHFGNSDPSQAVPSLIQVHTVDQEWDEATLTWNNAPLATENISRAWVDPLPSYPGWPGIPREWDVSGAVAEAYLAGDPASFVLYSADAPRHTGKYFFSSDNGLDARPMLVVTWGNPIAQ
jgi:hypothetical protein